MANIYNAIMKRFNGVDFDTIIPGGQESEFFEATYGSTTYVKLGQEYSNNKKIYYVDSLSGIYFYLYKTEIDSLSNRVFYFRGLNGEETKCSTSGWTVTKNNTQSYDNKLFLLENTVEEHTSAISDIEESIDDIEDDVETLNNKVDGLSVIGDEKGSLQTDLGEKWLLCNGDHYSAYDYPELAELLGTQEWYIDIPSMEEGNVNFTPDFYTNLNNGEIACIGESSSYGPCIILSNTKIPLTYTPKDDEYAETYQFFITYNETIQKYVGIVQREASSPSFTIELYKYALEDVSSTAGVHQTGAKPLYNLGEGPYTLPSSIYQATTYYSVQINGFCYWKGYYWLSLYVNDSNEGIQFNSLFKSSDIENGNWQKVLDFNQNITRAMLFVCEDKIVVMGAGSQNQIGIISSNDQVSISFYNAGWAGTNNSLQKISSFYFWGNYKISNIFGGSPSVQSITQVGLSPSGVAAVNFFYETSSAFIAVNTATKKIYKQDKTVYPEFDPDNPKWVQINDYNEEDPAINYLEGFVRRNGEIDALTTVGSKLNYRTCMDENFAVPTKSDAPFYCYIKAKN